MGLAETDPSESSQKTVMGPTRPLPDGSDRDFDSRSRVSNVSGGADETENLTLYRMLLDPYTGRLFSVGQSGSLSYLMLIRMIVGSVSGSSTFTEDPNRHNILENVIELPPRAKPSYLLPNKATADILIDSFFTNTSGFIEVFNKEDFLGWVENCYQDPPGRSEPNLVLLNLVFAIGLTVSRPVQGTDQVAVIQKLLSEPVNRAELFFIAAKKHHNVMSGVGDRWSIQIHILMTLYMLASARRNESYHYFGIASHTAFTLGLQREENSAIFGEPETRLRRNLWRTLFILDRFLAASLGRPILISEQDCSEHALEPLTKPQVDDLAPGGDMHSVSSMALDATVKSCYLIGTTLQKVYSQVKVSWLVAQEIADRLENWERGLHQNLHYRRITTGTIDATQAVSILHVNLLHCHSILLLTRPFFLSLLKGACDDRVSQRFGSRTEKFSQACVETSQRTIILARTALDAGYLPQCNPFVIYFVFSAALIILSNEFASLYHNPEAEISIHSALLILKYCEQMDVQAKRFLFIVERFHDANVGFHNAKIRDPAMSKKIYLPGRKTPTLLTLSSSLQHDAVSPFFHLVGGERRDTYVGDPSSMKERQATGMSTLSDHTVRPMMPPTLQQPSPEGSLSVNSNIASASMAPGIDVISGGDPEVNFLALWEGWGQEPPSYHISPDPAGSFDPYGLPPQIPQGNGLHHHTQTYPPPPDYR
ncbi:hypothetical protein M426DRAFT_7328 [Hypoxylon sp. CI-4A]|nr:hypothetical protein M426DRAFT_7328 [Hypoxylon sp. CI-4A]